MMEFVLDSKSTRARKAGYAARLRSKPVIAALIIVGILFELAGTALLLNGQAAGWIVDLPVVIPIVLYFWYQGDLKRISVGKYETPAG